ncbi:hypothetical protein [Streptomyces sp. NPDC001500]
MTEQQRKTRPPTSAEVLVARALGQPDPWAEIELETTPSAVRLAGRIQPVPESAKPPGMSTADWYARRAGDEEDGPDAA